MRGEVVILDCEAGRALGCASYCCRLIVRLRPGERDPGRPNEARAGCVDKDPLDGLCVHFDKQTGRCRVWDRRPSICRAFDCNHDPLLQVVLSEGYHSLTRLVKAEVPLDAARYIPYVMVGDPGVDAFVEELAIDGSVGNHDKSTITKRSIAMSLNPELLNVSLELVLERRPDFTPRFYEILFDRYPEVQPLFSRNGRKEQAKMLQEAIIAVVEHVENPSWLQDTLSSMGRKHVEYGVTDEMYPLVGECLIATLSEIAGDDWTDEIGASWVAAYGAISGIMIAAANEVAQAQ